MLTRPDIRPAASRAKPSSPLSLVILAGCLLGSFLLIGLTASQSGTAADKRSICQTNLAHLAFAFAQYCADNDGAFPNGTARTGPHRRAEAGLGWAGQIRPYVPNDRVFHCPADLEPTAYKIGTNVSYGYNVNLAGDVTKIPMLSMPSHTVLLFEVSGVWVRLDRSHEGAVENRLPNSAAGDGTPIYLSDGILLPRTVFYATGGGGGRPYFCPPPICSWPPTRHGEDASGIDGANYLMADGHVRWLGPDQVATGGTARNPTDDETGATYGRAAGTANPAFAATFSPK